MVFLGNPEYACDLFPADFVTIADGYGIRATRIEEAEHCGPQLEAAFERPGPVLVEAVVDEFTPPLPAKIKAPQAARLGEALLRGEPNRSKIVLTNLRDSVRELV